MLFHVPGVPYKNGHKCRKRPQHQGRNIWRDKWRFCLDQLLEWICNVQVFQRLDDKSGRGQENGDQEQNRVYNQPVQIPIKTLSRQIRPDNISRIGSMTDAPPTWIEIWTGFNWSFNWRWTEIVDNHWIGRFAACEELVFDVCNDYFVAVRNSDKGNASGTWLTLRFRLEVFFQLVHLMCVVLDCIHTGAFDAEFDDWTQKSRN